MGVENAILGAGDTFNANCLCGLAVSIATLYRGKGLSGFITNMMQTKANECSIRHLIVLLRPSLKSRCPLIATDHYVRWINRDGLPLQVDHHINRAVYVEPNMWARSTIA